MAIRLLAMLPLTAWLTLLAGCWWLAGPTARFTMSPVEGTSPLVVVFDASSSLAGAEDIVDYFWSFGDGATGVSRKMDHTYVTDIVHTFAVTLTITDFAGKQSSAQGSVKVHPSVPQTEPPGDEPVVRVEFVWPFNFDATGEDAAHLNDEYFTVQNTGDVVADMSGWTVTSEGGAQYRFPDGFVLAVGAYVMVHSGAGTDTYADLYWDASGPVWNNNSDIAFLSDAEGTIMDIYPYNTCILEETFLRFA